MAEPNLSNEEREAIRQYLLGRAPEAELTGLEERIISEDSFYEEVLIAEDDLIDQYLSGALSDPERTGFVSHFLVTNERLEKFRFSKNLRKYLDAQATTAPVVAQEPFSSARKSTQRNWFGSLFPGMSHPACRPLLMAASLLVVVGLSWIVLSNLLSEQPGGSGDLVIAKLNPGRTRDGGETSRISIPPGQDAVQLQLVLEVSTHGYQTYHAELKSIENTSSLLSRDRLSSEVDGAQRIVKVDVPADILEGGDYFVTLSGIGEAGTREIAGQYSFRIIK